MTAMGAIAVWARRRRQQVLDEIKGLHSALDEHRELMGQAHLDNQTRLAVLETQQENQAERFNEVIRRLDSQDKKIDYVGETLTKLLTAKRLH